MEKRPNAEYEQTQKFGLQEVLEDCIFFVVAYIYLIEK